MIYISISCSILCEYSSFTIGKLILYRNADDFELSMLVSRMVSIFSDYYDFTICCTLRAAVRQPSPAGCWTEARGGQQDSTTTSSALCWPPSGSRLRPVAELQRVGALDSCSDGTIFLVCHLRAAVLQSASAGCWRVPPTALYGPPPALEPDHNLPYVHNPYYGPNTYTHL